MENEEVLNIFIKTYTEHVEKNYDNLIEHKLDAFPLLKFSGHLNIAYIKTSKDIFNYPGYYLIVDNDDELKDEYDFVELDKDTKFKIIDSGYKFQRDSVLVENLFPKLLNKNVSILFGDYYGRKNLSSDVIEISAKSQADRDYNNWKNENKTKVSQYDHNTISPHSHLDYEGLINKFGKSDYDEDFKYQMNQAEECYKRKLYLPAAATLSVALETSLLALCDKHQVKLGNETMLNYLGQRLLDEKVINYRLGKRIDISYSLRNSLAHSNKGEVSKADCEIILNCIRIIIDEHY